MHFFGISFPSQKRGLSYAVLEFLTLLQIPGLSYGIYGISFPSPKMWTIICIFLNFFPFPIYMDYHMQFLEFLSLLPKRGLSYSISEISSPSPKTWFIICNFFNFLPFSKNVDYYKHFLEFMEFISLLQKRGL